MSHFLIYCVCYLVSFSHNISFVKACPPQSIHNTLAKAQCELSCIVLPFNNLECLPICVWKHKSELLSIAYQTLHNLIPNCLNTCSSHRLFCLRSLEPHGFPLASQTYQGLWTNICLICSPQLFLCLVSSFFLWFPLKCFQFSNY